MRLVETEQKKIMEWTKEYQYYAINFYFYFFSLLSWRVGFYIDIKNGAFYEVDGNCVENRTNSLVFFSSLYWIKHGFLIELIQVSQKWVAETNSSSNWINL